jgi:sugar porter (SP) family MFS transporter
MGKQAYLLMSLIAALSGILFGYDTGVISGAILFIAEEHPLTAAMNGWIVGSVLLGALSGAIVSGRLTDYFGRRKVLITAAVIFILGALSTAAAPSIVTLVVGRIIVGLAIGVASYVAPLYISEIAPKEHRGTLVSLNQLAITIGICLSYVVDYIFSFTGQWRWMLGLGVVPGMLLFLGMFYLPDSPRWILSQNREEDARRVLLKIRPSEKEVEHEIALIKLTLKEEAGDWRIILSSIVRPVLWIGCALAVIQQVTGINTILYYAPTILKMAGFGTDTISILATMGIGIVLVASTIITLIFIDRWGRRPLLLIGLVGMTIGLGVLGWLFGSQGEIAPSLHWLALASMLLYIASFSFSLGPVMWVMISEIYPLQVRGIGASIATCVNWASNLIVTVTFLELVHLLGARTTFFIYMVASIGSIVFIYFFVPETKGISLEEFEENLFAGKPWRKLGAP